MDAISRFAQDHALPESYLANAKQFFDPLADYCLGHAKAAAPFMLGLNGAQGSGKSTLSDYLVAYAESKGACAIALSIDDFYLTRAQRKTLAKEVHPLLATRGVPGTHDYALMAEVLSQLKVGKRPYLPRFNKGSDDRAPKAEWQRPKQTADLVIIEGWCWGAQPSAPVNESVAVPIPMPCNELEAKEDAKGQWRRYVQSALKQDLCPLYAFMDAWAMLRSPSFDCVYQWRLEQEQRLRAGLEDEGGDTSALMSPAQISRFIMHYQSITEALLQQLPKQADLVWQLDESRAISAVFGRNKALLKAFEAAHYEQVN